MVTTNESVIVHKKSYYNKIMRKEYAVNRKVLNREVSKLAPTYLKSVFFLSTIALREQTKNQGNHQLS